MRRVLALALILAMALLVRGAAQGEGLRTAALGLGFALIAAALAGDLFERLWLPRVSGYLIFGMACGPYLANIISRSMARELQLFNGLAIALIAFMAGLEINLKRIAPRLGAILRLGGITFGVVYTGLFTVFWFAWPWLPIAPQAAGPTRAAMALMLTTVVSSCSPTMTIAVITDTRSRGPLSELTLALVVMADLALIFVFTVAMQFVHWTLGTALVTEVGVVPRVTWEIVGSLAFGAAAGAVFAIYLRTIGRELTLTLLGLCVLLSEVGPHLEFEPLLAALAAGLVVENIAGSGGEALREAVEQGARPVLIVFFAAAGASLHLDALAVIGLVALLISVVRLGFIRAGTALGVRRSTIPPDVGRLVWMGLISKAGVTLGLTIILAMEFPTWGTRVETLMVAIIALHELVGPVLFKWALARSGEVGRMDAGATVPAGAAAARAEI